MSGVTSIKILSNVLNLVRPKTGSVRLFSAIIKCPETPPKKPNNCPEPGPPTRSKKCPEPAVKKDCSEPPSPPKPRECSPPAPTPKRPKPKTCGTKTSCRKPRPKNGSKCPKMDDDSKCKKLKDCHKCPKYEK